LRQRQLFDDRTHRHDQHAESGFSLNQGSRVRQPRLAVAAVHEEINQFMHGYPVNNALDGIRPSS
jgi:hypothetical protein